MKRGRKPGSMVNGTCKLCGIVESTRSAGKHFRCTACKAAGLRVPTEHARRVAWTDKDACGPLVAAAIRAGQLPSPRGLPCADCPGEATEYEHRDYSEPLKVEPICRACNSKRGPAIPRPGTFTRLLSEGFVPYKVRGRVEKLFATMGLPSEALRDMPKKLTHAHWMRLLPLFQTPIHQGR